MNGLMCGPPLHCGGSAHALTAHPAGTYALWRRVCYIPTTAKNTENDDTRGSKTIDPSQGNYLDYGKYTLLKTSRIC